MLYNRTVDQLCRIFISVYVIVCDSLRASYDCAMAEQRIDGKTVIITGASNGIGKETARQLLKAGEIQNIYNSWVPLDKCMGKSYTARSYCACIQSIELFDTKTSDANSHISWGCIICYDIGKNFCADFLRRHAKCPVSVYPLWKSIHVLKGTKTCYAYIHIEH